MESPRLRTAKAYLDHFATLDPARLAPLLADDYEHVMAPASLGTATAPLLTRDGFLAHNADLRRVLAGYPVRAREIWEGAGKEGGGGGGGGVVVAWATSRAVFREEVKMMMGEGEEEEEEVSWEYEGEYMFVLEMDASGEKVRRVVEFLDSKKTLGGIVPLMRKANERLAAREESRHGG